MSKLLLAAAAASFALLAGPHAFAASFASRTSGLGAGSHVVAACGTGLTFTYTTAFDPRISAYAVSGIELSNIPAGCLDETLAVTFYGSGDEAAGSAIPATLPSSGSTESIAVDGGSNTIAAGQISGVSVVVS